MKSERQESGRVDHRQHHFFPSLEETYGHTQGDYGKTIMQINGETMFVYTLIF